jgi:hypothetical protein
MLLGRLPSGRKVRLLGVTTSRLSDLRGSGQPLSLGLNEFVNLIWPTLII